MFRISVHTYLSAHISFFLAYTGSLSLSLLPIFLEFLMSLRDEVSKYLETSHFLGGIRAKEENHRSVWFPNLRLILLFVNLFK